MPAVNNPSPRPGFTRVRPQRVAPIVVGVAASATSLLALRRAADEAARQSAPLHVIAGGPAEDVLGPTAHDEREWHTVSAILKNARVTVSVVDETTAEGLVEYCRQVAASLLVVGCDQRAGHDELEGPGTTHQLVDTADCDVLVIHAQQKVGEPRSAERRRRKRLRG